MIIYERDVLWCTGCNSVVGEWSVVGGTDKYRSCNCDETDFSDGNMRDTWIEAHAAVDDKNVWAVA
jgi:hypothetical protein